MNSYNLAHLLLREVATEVVYQTQDGISHDIGFVTQGLGVCVLSKYQPVNKVIETEEKKCNGTLKHVPLGGHNTERNIYHHICDTCHRNYFSEKNLEGHKCQPI